MNLDQRLNAWRPDLADKKLYGKVESQHFVVPVARQICQPVASLRRAPDDDAPQDCELLHGDIVDMFETEKKWSWVQNRRDGYVGYCCTSALGKTIVKPTHQVNTRATILFKAPDLKSPAQGFLSMTAQVTICGQDKKFSKLATGGWIFSDHLSTLDDHAPDILATARRFRETPYLWGGNSSFGIDCSGLVQIVLRRVGIQVPRDTDLQEQAVGYDINYRGDIEQLAKGDLVFWKGHVGFYSGANRLLHANATDMKVTEGSFDQICAQIRRMENISISCVKRIKA